jgi:hypothetical protein
MLVLDPILLITVPCSRATHSARRSVSALDGTPRNLNQQHRPDRSGCWLRRRRFRDQNIFVKLVLTILWRARSDQGSPPCLCPSNSEWYTNRRCHRSIHQKRLLDGRIFVRGTVPSLSFFEERTPPFTALTRRFASRSHIRTWSVLRTGVNPTLPTHSTIWLTSDSTRRRHRLASLEQGSELV